MLYHIILYYIILYHIIVYCSTAEAAMGAVKRSFQLVVVSLIIGPPLAMRGVLACGQFFVLRI